MHPRLNVLFVCGRNKRRSPTAERVFKHDPRMNVRAAGLTERSPRRLNESDVRWADIIMVMERKYARRIRVDFRQVDPLPPMADLDISDEYLFMQPELVALMKASVVTALETYWLEQAAGGEDGP